ncbi:hypothetical protein D3C80_1748320 [compost metagenome]
MRFNARSPALALLTEIYMIIENLRLLFERQLADIHHGAAVCELGKVALPEPAPRRFIDMFSGSYKKSIAMFDRGPQLGEGRRPVLHIIVA